MGASRVKPVTDLYAPAPWGIHEEQHLGLKHTKIHQPVDLSAFKNFFGNFFKQLCSVMLNKRTIRWKNHHTDSPEGQPQASTKKSQRNQEFQQVFPFSNASCHTELEWRFDVVKGGEGVKKTGK
jgi:hypothetical protein